MQVGFQVMEEEISGIVPLVEHINIFVPALFQFSTTMSSACSKITLVSAKKRLIKISDHNTEAFSCIM